MTERVRFRMLGRFSILVNHQCCDLSVAKSKKGMSLLQYLILQYDAPVPNHKLIQILWPHEESSNPENALKTLVSRFRTILNQCSEGLGDCIAATRGGYRFKILEGLTLDLLDFEDIAKRLTGCSVLTTETDALYQEALALYAGHLLEGCDHSDWDIDRGVSLHGQYLRIVYAYLDLLKNAARYGEVIQTCRIALEKDPFDERLHLALMQALVSTHRSNEALILYKHVAHINFRFLGAKPPEGIQAFYKQIIQTGDTLDLAFDTIRRELQESDHDHGAYECEYAVFREIFGFQARPLERLGSQMYVGMIMITGMDGEPIQPLMLDVIMKGLYDVLRQHLRMGDTLTHYSPSQYVLCLPAVNAESGRMIMEGIKRSFFQRFPGSNVLFSYRIAPVSPNDTDCRTAAD